jgi:hypothetical protein
VDAEGEYKSAVYGRIYDSWTGFIREIGEYTEASYHYPQGTHVGHILAVLWYFGLRSRKGTPFEDQYIRLRGGFGEGRIAIYRRQVKFKLQAAMELGILARPSVGDIGCSASVEKDISRGVFGRLP